MENSRGSWTVVTVLNESIESTLRFVSWYLVNGAARVVLYFDNPDDPSIEFLQSNEQVECIRCDDEFWTSLGTTKDARFTLRQVSAINHGYRNLQTEWMLNVDSDEFVYFSKENISQFLASQTDDINVINIGVAEYLSTSADDNDPYSGPMNFRTPCDHKYILRHIHGENTWYFSKKRGLVGHTDGKSFIRKGMKDIHVRQHWPQDAGKNVICDLKLGPEDNAYILHFLTRGFDKWQSRLEWRVKSWNFAKRVKLLLVGAIESKDEKRLKEAYNLLHVADKEKLDRMRETGCLLELELPFNEHIKTFFPNYT